MTNLTILEAFNKLLASTKKYIDNKIADQPQLLFNDNGELVVTINGVSKIFIPKEETVSASYDKSTEKIIISDKV